MKLSIGLSAVLASFVAAASVQPAGEVYMLPAPEAETTSFSPSLARLILLQRVATSGKGPSIHDIPEDVNPEDAVELMNKFGKPVTPLFEDNERAAPSQLVIMLEGMTETQMKELAATFKTKPAFTITNPPSSSAHEKLMKNDFYNAGIMTDHKCDFQQIANPLEKACWNGKSAVAKYNVAKQPELLDEFFLKWAGFETFAEIGEMQTTVVLLPAVPESASSKHWSNKPELRRRQAETVITYTNDDVPQAAPTSSHAHNPIFYATKNIPSCFQSEDSCSTGTKNCSGHGFCQNKWANSDGSSRGAEVCFTCRCLSTVSAQGSLTHWAGPSCAKQDISFQFWLFAGFTIAMVGVLSLGIGMLFSVGEEKLPGVIGAGVSRSK